MVTCEITCNTLLKVLIRELKKIDFGGCLCSEIELVSGQLAEGYVSDVLRGSRSVGVSQASPSEKKDRPFKHSAATIAWKAEERRETLRKKIYDSQQLRWILSDIQGLADIHTKVSKASPGLYIDKSLATQQRLEMDLLNSSLNHRLKLLNKVLPDDKVTVVEDKESALPELKLTLVTDGKKKAA